MRDNGYKFLTAAKLIELLQQLPPDSRLVAKTKADTGNLAVLDSNWEPLGWIDFVDETVERY